MTVSAISSTIAANPFWITSSVIGSIPDCGIPPSLPRAIPWLTGAMSSCAPQHGAAAPAGRRSLRNGYTPVDDDMGHTRRRPVGVLQGAPFLEPTGIEGDHVRPRALAQDAPPLQPQPFRRQCRELVHRLFERKPRVLADESPEEPADPRKRAEKGRAGKRSVQRERRGIGADRAVRMLVGRPEVALVVRMTQAERAV